MDLYLKFIIIKKWYNFSQKISYVGNKKISDQMLLKTGNLFIQLNRRSICGKAEMDAKIRAYQQSVSVLDDAIDKITFSQLPANNPIEDHYSIAKCLHTNSYFFGLFLNP